MEKVIANIPVKVNEQGYLLDFSQWNEDIARELAREKGIVLTDEHWRIIRYLQEKHKADEPLSIRGIKKSGIIPIKEFYRLFPGGPLKVASLIAGIPKPKSCL